MASIKTWIKFALLSSYLMVCSSQNSAIQHLNMKFNRLNRITNGLQKDVDDIWTTLSDTAVNSHKVVSNTTKQEQANSKDVMQLVNETVSDVKELKTEVEELVLYAKNGLEKEKIFNRDTMTNMIRSQNEFQTNVSKEISEMKSWQHSFEESQLELQHGSGICSKPKDPANCNDIYEQNPHAGSGEYTIYTSSGAQVEVYCDFYGTQGYIFLSKTALSKFESLDGLYSITDHAVVRVLYTNKKQHDVKISQLTEYQSRLPLSFQLSATEGYKRPQNHARLPYIYLGLIPADRASLPAARPEQGYNAGGRDITFKNSDKNPNSYIAFFGNDGNVPENDYYKRCCESAVGRAWFENDQPLPEGRYMKRTENYFFFYEMHMGGGGTYFTSSHGMKYDVSGASLGLGFEIKKRC